MATLVVSATTDFSNVIFSDVDEILFTNLLGPATASFPAARFNNVTILDGVLITGNAEINAIEVTGGSIDASLWQFEDWVFGDTITLTGTGLADTMTGSSVNDVISGASGRDIIIGGADPDILSGGGGNDRFLYLNSADSGFFFEEIDGGNGTADRIVLEDDFDGLSLFFATITNVEALVFKTGGFAMFSGAAFGSGGITTVKGSSGDDQLRVSGSLIDLSAVTFENWTEAIVIPPEDVIFAYGLGATDDDITGSRLNDLVHGFSGDDTLDGGEGNDTLYGDEGRDTIDGGEGDDTIDFQNDTMIEDAESIDGGSGNDMLMLHEADPGETYDFTTSIMSGIEVLSVIGPILNADTVTVKFAEGQFGAGGINAAVVNSPLAIEISAGAVDLSTVAFSGLTEDTTISITGITGSDVLIGSTLADIIIGGSSGDVMLGEGGGDTFVYDAGSDIVTGEFVDGSGGSDTLELSSGFSGEAQLPEVIMTSIERLAMLKGDQLAILSPAQILMLEEIEAVGGHQSIAVNGQAIDLSHLAFTKWSPVFDVITLTGTEAEDSIVGSAESDLIFGAAGSDNLTGNGGADIFVYESIDDSTTGTGRDIIEDFVQTEDQIDLAELAASISFIGDDEFNASGDAELRYTFTNNGTTQVSIDTDGNGTAESHVIFRGQIAFAETDFLLVK